MGSSGITPDCDAISIGDGGKGTSAISLKRASATIPKSRRGIVAAMLDRPALYLADPPRFPA
jgi:hypothetical protein